LRVEQSIEQPRIGWNEAIPSKPPSIRFGGGSGGNGSFPPAFSKPFGSGGNGSFPPAFSKPFGSGGNGSFPPTFSKPFGSGGNGSFHPAYFSISAGLPLHAISRAEGETAGEAQPCIFDAGTIGRRDHEVWIDSRLSARHPLPDLEKLSVEAMSQIVGGVAGSGTLSPLLPLGGWPCSTPPAADIFSPDHEDGFVPQLGDSRLRSSLKEVHAYA
jgi:hypothetical protein